MFDPAGGADQLAAAAWWVILEPEVWLEPHAVAAFTEFIEDLPDDVTAFTATSWRGRTPTCATT